MKRITMTLILTLLFTSARLTWAQDDHHHDSPHGDPPHAKHKPETHRKAVRLAPGVSDEFDIVVEKATGGILERQAVLPGEVQINRDRQAHIVPRYPGLVIEVRKTIGDQVKQGDVLAVLEGNESLVPYELKSLIDGTIVEKHITLGESLTDNAVVFTVADLDTVWIDLTVYQKDIGSVRPGQQAVIYGSEHLPTAEGTISYVSPTVDEHTRTGTARVVLPNHEGAWKPGLFVTSRIALDRAEADVVVPKTALQTVGGEHVVFVETDEGFEPRTVEVGRSDPARVEILSGLHAGERYVSRGSFTIKSEMARGVLEHAGHAH